MEVEIEQESEEIHDCIGFQEGDRVLFVCQQCPYIRVINWKEQTINVLVEGEEGVTHRGSHQPISFEQESCN